MNEIQSFISSVGFPIAMCCAMFYQMNKQSQIISDNTIAIQKLTDKLELKVADTTNGKE